MKNYGDKWGRIDSWAKQKLVINNIARSKLPVFLGLLGGEPTLHPHYNELVDRCLNAVTKHPDGRLYITTNGSQQTSIFEKHKYDPCLYFLFSFHPEYESRYGRDFKQLRDNIETAKSRYFRVEVNVMLSPNEKLWKKTHKFVDTIEAYNDKIVIHPHFLYEDGNVHKLEKYNQQFYNEFRRFQNYPDYFTFETSTGERTQYNDYNIFENEFTNFKDWDCWNNNYEISYDGIVHRVCFNEPVDLIKDIFYFKKISSICPVKCPHTSCNCDGLLKIYKEKNNNVTTVAQR